MCGNWLHSGVYTEAGNNAQRRVTTDPTGLGMYHNWAFSWPANRRVMYNRASADAEGKAWDPKRPGIVWNGEKWVGDVPDIKADSPPGEFGAFIMLPEGVGRLFSAPLARRPLPRALRGRRGTDRQPPPSEGHVQPHVQEVLLGQGRLRQEGGFPDRLHHVPADRALPLLDAAPASGRPERAPARLLRRDPGGPREGEGHRQRIAGQGQLRRAARSRESRWSPNGCCPLKIDGKPMWQIGFPIHWGYAGDPKHTGSAGQPADALGHGPEHVDARVQGLSRETREGVRGRRP